MRTGRAFSAGRAIGLRPADDFLIAESETDRDSAEFFAAPASDGGEPSLPSTAAEFVAATDGNPVLAGPASFGLNAAFAIVGFVVSDARCEDARRGRSNAAKVKFERSPRIS